MTAAILSFAPRVPAPPVRLEADWAERPSAFRFVLPHDKRLRLEARARAMAAYQPCSVSGCATDALAVLLVEAEEEARLCPRHLLVNLAGIPLPGRPILAIPTPVDGPV